MRPNFFRSGSVGRPFRTKDSALSYYINQLENFDPKLHQPLVNITWSRDIQLRPGLTMAYESSSFTRSTFAGSGTLNQAGAIPWVNDQTTTIPGVSINGEKVDVPLRLAAREVVYSSPELERSALTGQNIDTAKLDALNLMYQMNIDQMVYVGATEVGATGLVNSSLVTAANVANGASGSPLWVNKTPDEILADINTVLVNQWTAAGYAVMATKLLLPPIKFSYLVSQKVSSAGNISILKYLQENSIANSQNGRPLEILPLKWLVGRGASGTDRMVAYTNEVDRIRYPMVPIRRETPYYLGIKYHSPYLYALGQMEFVYPETVYYADGF